MEKENRTSSKIYSSNLSDLIETIENLGLTDTPKIHSKGLNDSPVKFLRSPKKSLPLQPKLLNSENQSQKKEEIGAFQKRKITLFKSSLKLNGKSITLTEK